jgi:hypothetical protein
MLRALVTSIIAVGLLAGPLAPVRAADTQIVAIPGAAARWSMVVSAQRLIGNWVEGRFGGQIAEVADVIFDVDGRGVYAVLSVPEGGDGPDRLVAVPYHRFSFVGPSVVVLPVTRDQLLAEPQFDYEGPPLKPLGGS